jgi:hypothetical protein
MRSQWLCIALLAVAFPPHAILIRPDRDDAEYLELATRYPSSIPLGAPDGEGTLIAPRWVLTAAHMAKALQELKTAPKLSIGDASHAIAGRGRQDRDPRGPWVHREDRHETHEGGLGREEARGDQHRGPRHAAHPRVADQGQ